MKPFLTQLKGRLPRWWGRRVPTEADFKAICRRERIKIVELPLRIPGYYMLGQGKPFIVINSSLTGLRRLHVAFHELGHHFLHAPQSTGGAFFFSELNSKEHAEAEAFALCTLIPVGLLEILATVELREEDEFSRKLLAERKQLNDLYGI